MFTEVALLAVHPDSDLDAPEFQTAAEISRQDEFLQAV
jgi:hypothetical protein